jgi:DNA polymerase-3 subunit alpha
MESFAGYGFNKSHAAAYSLLAYHTAWLKVHHTVEFFCANMTVEMDNTDKLKVLFEDAVKMGLAFEPPHINRGGHRFEPVSNTVIRYGLGAVRGTGQQAIESIVAARQAGGDFTSLFDFCVRIDRTRVNKRSVEALIKGVRSGRWCASMGVGTVTTTRRERLMAEGSVVNSIGCRRSCSSESSRVRSCPA